MNRIKVVNNRIIPFDNSDVLINDNKITFLSNGNYSIMYIDCDNVNIEFEVSEDGYVDVMEYSENDDINVKNYYTIQKNGTLVVRKFYCNHSTDEIINIYLKGDKASVKYCFSSISNNKDNYTFNVYHLAKKTSSDLFNRTIARKDSENFFDINSFVDNGIKDCYLNQQTKIITLGDSNNRINPNMFIGENSTEAFHSGVIGSISEDDLFYLMSRGIGHDDAVKLIIKGMLISNINPDTEIREKILGILGMLGGE